MLELLIMPHNWVFKTEVRAIEAQMSPKQLSCLLFTDVSLNRCVEVECCLASSVCLLFWQIRFWLTKTWPLTHCYYLSVKKREKMYKTHSSGIIQTSIWKCSETELVLSCEIFYQCLTQTWGLCSSWVIIHMRVGGEIRVKSAHKIHFLKKNNSRPLN